MKLQPKRKPTADDVRRVALAALVSALDEGKQDAKKKPGLTGVRAVATGAVIYTAGVAAFKGRRFVQDQIAAYRDDADDDEEFDEYDEEYDEADEPEAEEEDFDEDEERDEPEAEEDERPETPDLQPIQRVARGKKRQPSLALFERPSRSRSPIG